MATAAAGATAGGSSKAKSAFVSVFKNVAPMGVGFGVGWWAWSFADSSGVVDETQKRKLYHHTQVAEAKLAAWLPEGWAEKLNLPLNPPLADGDGGDASSAVPFTEIMESCRVAEQLDWLLDHLSEEIPYFYIHDLFAAFAAVYEKRWIEQPREPAPGGRDPKRKGVHFDKEDLDMLHREQVVDLTWQRTVSGVLPVATGLRALAVLCMDKENALWLSRYAAMEVDKHAGAKLEETGKSTGKQLSRGQLAEAVLQLLHEKHFAEKRRMGDGGSSDRERDAHAARAGIQLLGQINDALVEHQSAWWRGMLRSLRLASRPEFSSVPVLAPNCFYAPAASPSSTLDEESGETRFSAQRTLMAAINEIQLAPQPDGDANNEGKLEELADSPLMASQLCDRTIHEHSSWMSQFLEGVKAHKK